MRPTPATVADLTIGDQIETSWAESEGPARPARPRRSRVRRAWTAVAIVLAVLVGLLGGLLTVGTTYEAYASARDRRDHPAPGTLVDVGESRIHLVASGSPDHDEPTVVLLPGATSVSTTWAHVQAELDDQLRVVAYDRPGLGWSERHGESVDAVTQADLLLDTLLAAGEAPPFVLVGHSLGGAHARVFAARHPGVVAGVVLVDALHPRIWDVMSAEDAEEQQAFVDRARYLPAVARTGLLRLMDPFGPATEGLPDSIADAVVARSLQIRHLETAADELDQLRPGSPTVEQLADADTSLPAVPFAVVTRGDSHSTTPAQQALDRDLAAAVSGTHVVVPDADHTELLTHAEYAAVVVDAVRRVVSN